MATFYLLKEQQVTGHTPPLSVMLWTWNEEAVFSTMWARVRPNADMPWALWMECLTDSTLLVFLEVAAGGGFAVVARRLDTQGGASPGPLSLLPVHARSEHTDAEDAVLGLWRQAGVPATGSGRFGLVVEFEAQHASEADGQVLAVLAAVARQARARYAEVETAAQVLLDTAPDEAVAAAVRRTTAALGRHNYRVLVSPAGPVAWRPLCGWAETLLADSGVPAVQAHVKRPDCGAAVSLRIAPDSLCLQLTHAHLPRVVLSIEDDPPGSLSSPIRDSKGCVWLRVDAQTEPHPHCVSDQQDPTFTAAAAALAEVAADVALSRQTTPFAGIRHFKTDRASGCPQCAALVLGGLLAAVRDRCAERVMWCDTSMVGPGPDDLGPCALAAVAPGGPGRDDTRCALSALVRATYPDQPPRALVLLCLCLGALFGPNLAAIAAADGAAALDAGRVLQTMFLIQRAGFLCLEPDFRQRVCSPDATQQDQPGPRRQ